MNKKEIVIKVETALDLFRPYLLSDGGDIRFVELTDDFDVVVELSGTCSSCPFIEQTLKTGVEHYIKKEAPEVKNVIPVFS